MEQALAILANLATIATFVIALYTLDKVKKVESRTRINVDQSSGKDAASRADVRQGIRGNRNTQIGRDINA